VLAEVGARLFLRLPARIQPTSLALKVQVPEDQAPGMLECLMLDGRAVAHYPTLDGGEIEIPYRTSPQGFRDRPRSRERTPGTYRIAVLGDSVAFGFGIPEEHAAPQILERLFDEHLGPGRVEVMNCGIYSFNATQQAAHLAYRVADFRPDLVLFLTTVTDASGRGIVADPGKSDRWEVRWTRRLGLTSGRFDPGESSVPPAQRRMLALRRRSALADYVANRTFTWLRGRVMSDGYEQDWLAGSPGRAAVKEAYTRARDLGRERGFDVWVAMYPVLDRLDDYPLESVHTAVAEICEELGLEFVDLLPAVEGLKATELQAHAHDKHPNGIANRYVAELLEERLEPVIRASLGE
jgi:hypothetical protein